MAFKLENIWAARTLQKIYVVEYEDVSFGQTLGLPSCVKNPGGEKTYRILGRTENALDELGTTFIRSSLTAQNTGKKTSLGEQLLVLEVNQDEKIPYVRLHRGESFLQRELPDENPRSYLSLKNRTGSYSRELGRGLTMYFRGDTQDSEENWRFSSYEAPPDRRPSDRAPYGATVTFTVDIHREKSGQPNIAVATKDFTMSAGSEYQYGIYCQYVNAYEVEVFLIGGLGSGHVPVGRFPVEIW